MVGDMTRPVGVLALRIWRNEANQLRARVSANLDAADSTAPEISHYSSTRKPDSAMTATRST